MNPSILSKSTFVNYKKLNLSLFLKSSFQKCLKHKQKPPQKVEAVLLINTISSHVGQLGRLDCMGYDGV